MSSNTTQRKVRYVVYMPHDRDAKPTPFLVPEDSDVDTLEAAICEHRNFKHLLVHDRVTLLKCDDLSMLDPKLYELALEWIRKYGTKRMDGSCYLNKYFKDGPAPAGDEKIDVIAMTETKSPDVLYALPDGRASKVTKDRLSQIGSINHFPPPSEGVRSEEKIKSWINENGVVHPHWPTKNYGPPTELFHPALARLKHRLMHLDQIEEPSAKHFEWAHKFLVTCGDGFEKEALWDGELKFIINALIDEDATWQQFLQGNTANPDARWGKITRMILELKNLDGVHGNATLQALLDYAKVLAQPKHKACVSRSNCPVVLIGIMGTRLEISTAIFTDGIYTDKLLSEDFYIDAWQSETVLRVGRIFKALSLVNVELRDFYARFNDDLEAELTIDYMYPNPVPLEGSIPRLKYLGKLSRMGKLLDENDKRAIREERTYALYRAKMIRDESPEEMDVVVKFTAHYHEEAHRILEKNQLAPKLHFCIRLFGGMYMVIMDYIEGTPLFFVKKKPRTHDKICSDVETAVKLLHEHGLVFGDLRDQNIILKPSGDVVLIDFDWVGEHQKDRYPASWNESELWAPDVGRRVLMDKTHDTVMLERLKNRWDN